MIGGGILSVKDDPTTANDAGTGYLDVATNNLVVLQTGQLGFLLDFDGVATTADLVTRGSTGYIRYTVLGGPAEVVNPQTNVWGSIAESAITSTNASDVQIRAKGKSAHVNDISVRVEWGIDNQHTVEVITWLTTAYSPLMVLLSSNTFPIQNYTGYESDFDYKVVFEQVPSVLWPGLGINEKMDLPHHDSIVNNWPDIQQTHGTTTQTGLFTDHLWYFGSLSPHPEPPYDAYGVPNPNANPEVISYSNQIWRGGSEVIGLGHPMESAKTMHYYLHSASRN